MSLPFPFAVIDFEASSLSDERSYPIEVGVAIATAKHAPLQIWSTLIQPTPQWLARGKWSARSAAVHGITLAELAEAATPGDVARTLNAIAETVPRWFCDGGDWDAHGLRQVFDAARIAPGFAVASVFELVADRESRGRFADALTKTEAPHRAGPDAARLCEALLLAHRPAARD